VEGTQPSGRLLYARPVDVVDLLALEGHGPAWGTASEELNATLLVWREGEGQPAALVIVPDNQLSLAIGKKGQNARLAAKLTGMRIDIKSESEVESDRVDAEEARSVLTRVAGGAPEVVEALEAAGFGSPRAIVDAGREALHALPAVGDQADKIYAAAEEWIAAHAQAAAAAAAAAAAPVAGAEPAGAEPEPPSREA